MSERFGLFSDPTRLVGYADGSISPISSVAFVVRPGVGREPRPSDDSLELRVVSRDDLHALRIWPAHEPIRNGYLALSGDVAVE